MFEKFSKNLNYPKIKMLKKPNSVFYDFRQYKLKLWDKKLENGIILALENQHFHGKIDSPVCDQPSFKCFKIKYFKINNKNKDVTFQVKNILKQPKNGKKV